MSRSLFSKKFSLVFSFLSLMVGVQPSVWASVDCPNDYVVPTFITEEVTAVYPMSGDIAGCKATAQEKCLRKVDALETQLWGDCIQHCFQVSNCYPQSGGVWGNCSPGTYTGDPLTAITCTSGTVLADFSCKCLSWGELTGQP